MKYYSIRIEEKDKKVPTNQFLHDKYILDFIFDSGIQKAGVFGEYLGKI